MTDFLNRLIERTLAGEAAIAPLIAPIYALGDSEPSLGEVFQMVGTQDNPLSTQQTPGVVEDFFVAQSRNQEKAQVDPPQFQPLQQVSPRADLLRAPGDPLLTAQVNALAPLVERGKLSRMSIAQEPVFTQHRPFSEEEAEHSSHSQASMPVRNTRLESAPSVRSASVEASPFSEVTKRSQPGSASTPIRHTQLERTSSVRPALTHHGHLSVEAEQSPHSQTSTPILNTQSRRASPIRSASVEPGPLSEEADCSHLGPASTPVRNTRLESEPPVRSAPIQHRPFSEEGAERPSYSPISTPVLSIQPRRASSVRSAPELSISFSGNPVATSFAQPLADPAPHGSSQPVAGTLLRTPSTGDKESQLQKHLPTPLRSSSDEVPATTPTIQVKIGRIEVQATPQPATSRTQPGQQGASIPMSLNQYLHQRGQGGH